MFEQITKEYKYRKTYKKWWRKVFVRLYFFLNLENCSQFSKMKNLKENDKFKEFEIFMWKKRCFRA